MWPVLSYPATPRLTRSAEASTAAWAPRRWPPPPYDDHRPGPGADTGTPDGELLDRASRDDYQRWLATAAGRGWLRPADPAARQVRDINTATGEILRTFDTAACPTG